MAAVTSFKKKSSSKPSHPHGTKPSLHNAQLLTSTGVPFLDPLLGGGITIGSILLVEEDQYEHYSRILLKYFLAEGIMCGHTVILGGTDESAVSLINDLPAAVFEPHQPSSMPSLAEEDMIEESETIADDAPAEMKIAWRYKSKPVVKSSFSNQFGHHFDLTKRMDGDMLDRVQKHTFIPTQDTTIRSAGSIYKELQEFIVDSLKTTSSDMNNTKQPNVVKRIALRSLGSPLWLQDTVNGNATDLTSFIHSFRAIVRDSNAVGLVTIPTHLFQDTTIVKRLERLFDGVVRIESFEGSDKGLNPLYKDYHGLFHLVKLPRINSLTAHYPETLDLTFKLRRKKFVIEKLHLPPELSSTANRAQEDPVKPIKNTAITIKTNKTPAVTKGGGPPKLLLGNLQVQNEF